MHLVHEIISSFHHFIICFLAFQTEDEQLVSAPAACRAVLAGKGHQSFVADHHEHHYDALDHG